MSQNWKNSEPEFVWGERCWNGTNTYVLPCPASWGICQWILGWGTGRLSWALPRRTLPRAVTDGLRSLSMSLLLKRCWWTCSAAWLLPRTRSPYTHVLQSFPQMPVLQLCWLFEASFAVANLLSCWEAADKISKGKNYIAEQKEDAAASTCLLLATAVFTIKVNETPSSRDYE